MHMGVCLHACMSVHHVWPVPAAARSMRVLDTPELELQKVVSCHLDVGNSWLLLEGHQVLLTAEPYLLSYKNIFKYANACC